MISKLTDNSNTEFTNNKEKDKAKTKKETKLIKQCDRFF